MAGTAGARPSPARAFDVDVYRSSHYIGNMTELKFTWDPAKAEANRRKHGVTFEEASTVFRDSNGLRIYDPDHSLDEDRFLLLGISQQLRLLVVVHCYRETDEVVRIISARKATRREAGQYGRTSL